MLSMEAIILAGGKGTRLQPYTTVLPKPLMPVGGKPIISIIINQLKQAGVSRITLAVNYMADIIATVIGDGKKYGVDINYSTETVPLGTIGPIRLIKDLPEDFLVMNGDILTNLDYQGLFGAHRESGCLFTIATCKREIKIDFGVLEVDPTKRQLTGHSEKPVYRFDVSMGIYVMNRALIEKCPVGVPYGVDNLAIDMLKRNESINIYPFSGYWLDIGRPDDFQRANLEIESLGLLSDS